jgi:Tfp pilus assembly protein PilF
LLLTQTVALKNRFRDADILGGGIIVAGALAVMNFQHQRNFKDPLTFWTAAAATSPNSAYANMMLAAREDNLEESYRLFRKAYRLNPKEKYLNFYYGVMLQKQDSVAKSEQFLLTEKNSSGYYECDFYLARVAMERKDLNGAISYLQTYLKKDATNKIANNNLLLLYMDTQQRDKAAQHVKTMRQLGLEVPPQLMQQLQ